MKRVKIMLTAIGVLAVVGGAVAFKSKTVGSTTYCFTTSQAASARCNLSISSVTFLPTGSNTYKYTTTTNPSACNAGNPAGVPCDAEASNIQF